MKFTKLALLVTFFCASRTLSGDKIKIVTTLPDLASLVQIVGGDKVEITNLVKGTQDPHHLEVLPSYMVKLRNADLFFIIGMDLELWAPPLRDGSRNARLEMIDCSENIQRLETPTSEVNPSMGDIHIYGNPHYWLDPENGRLLVQTIDSALERIAPTDKDYFAANARAFNRQLDEKIADWQQRLAPYTGQKIIFYHNSWPYFLRRFGLKAANFIEPIPGVDPSPAHTQTLIRQIKEQNIKIIAMEPFFNRRVPDRISAETGIKVIILPSSVGGIKDADNYFSLFDSIVHALEAAL